MEKAAAILIIIGIGAIGVALRFTINYFIHKASRKAGDAIHNSIARKRNEKLENESENLADRYK